MDLAVGHRIKAIGEDMERTTNMRSGAAVDAKTV